MGISYSGFDLKRCVAILHVNTMEGPRTRVGQPKMKYWKLHELHKNEVKNVHPIIL